MRCTRNSFCKAWQEAKTGRYKNSAAAVQQTERKLDKKLVWFASEEDKPGFNVNYS